MIEIHPNMNDQYQNTFFGILVLQNFCEQSGGKETFRRFTYDELKKIRNFHLNYERKIFCETDEVVKCY